MRRVRAGDPIESPRIAMERKEFFPTVAPAAFRLEFGVGCGKAPSVQASGEGAQLKATFSVKFIAAVGHAETVTAWVAPATVQALVRTVLCVCVGEAMTGLAALVPAPLAKLLT